VLGALAVLHDSRTVTHGALAPERVILTATGRVVMAEHVLAQALDRMQAPRHQLWRDWRIATPPGPGNIRFDIKTDLGQLGLLALAAVLGRPIEEEEYPHRLRGLLLPAQDRLAKSPAGPIAVGLASWIERLMPVESKKAFGSVREAQQAFEALVSPKASAIGLAPARVKGVLAAIAAISAQTPAPASPPEPASAIVITAPVAEPPVSAPASDDIDIEALLRLEAELEGGTAPVPTPLFGGLPMAQPDASDEVLPEVVAPPVTEGEAVAAEPAPAAANEPEPEADALPAMPDAVPVDEVVLAVAAEQAEAAAPLDVIAQERVDLERQLAALVDAVAPPAAAVRLIPETPATAEPLVDARVLWSSMPGADALETTVSDNPTSTDVASRDGAADEQAATHVEPFVFAPIAIQRTDDAAPAAALDAVPSEWWREALPWRDEAATTVETSDTDAVVAALGVEAEPKLVPSPIDMPVEAAVPAVVDEAPVYGYLPDDFAVVPVTVVDAHIEAVDHAASAVAAVEALDESTQAALAEPVAASEMPIVEDAIGHGPRWDHGPCLLDGAVPSVVDVSTSTHEPIADVDVDAVETVGQDAVAFEETAPASGVETEDVESAEVAAVDIAAAESFDVVTTSAEQMDVDDASQQAAAVSVDVYESLDVELAAASVADDVVVEDSEPGAMADAVGEALERPLAVIAHEVPAAAMSLEADDAVALAPEAVAAAPLVLDTTNVVIEVADADVVPAQETAPSVWADQLTVAVPAVATPSAGWFSRDALPMADVVEPTEADDLPLATGGFRAFGGLNDATRADAAVVDDGPAMRTTFTFAASEPTPAEPSSAAAFALESPFVDEAEPSVIDDASSAPIDEANEVASDADVASSAAAVETPWAAVEAVADRGVDDAADASWLSAIEPASVVEAEPDVAPYELPVVVAEVEPFAGSILEPIAGSLPVITERTATEDIDVVIAEVTHEDAPLTESDSAEAPIDLAPDVDVFAAVEETSPAPAKSAPAPDLLPDAVPEVVIVDGGEDRDAWEQLPSEAPAAPEATVVEHDDAEVEPGVSIVAASTETASSRKKRRRSRRRKGQPAPPAPVSQPVAVPVMAPVPSAMPAVVHAVVPAAVHPVVASVPLAAPDVAAESSPDPATPARRSLLDREVPTWTPSDAVEIRVRPLLRRPEPVVEAPGAIEDVPMAPSVTIEQAAVREPAIAVAPVPVAPVAPTIGPPLESFTHFEPEIKAVGMPDLDEVRPGGRGASVTSMADAIGNVSSRSGAIDRGHVLAPPVAESSSWNWRRIIAASIIIALCNGGVFAAWWWVQPGTYGTLVVQTAQAGVEVVLDGKTVGKTPFREEVEPGRHKLTLRHNGQMREMPVEITLGVVTTQALEWPIPEGGGRGNLQVTSTPTGARIYVNGALRGEAPMLIENLPAGKQTLTLRGEAGTVMVSATVMAGETTPLEVPIFAGWVVIDAPVEMNLMLRGTKIGSTMDGQILLSPGRHQIEAVSDALGFRRTLSVMIEPGEVKRVAVSIPPVQLQVQDEPGSEVFVDGERIGALPNVLTVPLGTHDVLVRRPDGSERRQTLTVRAGSTATM
ncbi:MAG TPA: PEGA domain-containing protein, partial [Luteitalea sp.]|nr:PEGA domain-containing protein [Luteitalea sp.]